MDVKILPRIIDLSCVKTDIVKTELEEMVKLAAERHFVCCFAMPYYTGWLCDQLKDYDDIAVGGAIGFPSGSVLTRQKVDEAKYFLSVGCKEFDMVMNISALKSKDYDEVQKDIMAVKEVVGDNLFKVIIEVPCLTDYEICKASEIVVKCGADYVKTGTGWQTSPTRLQHIKLIKSVVGNDAKIKAAGGIHSLNDIVEMNAAGCSRFGIGIRRAKLILKEAGILDE